MQRKIFFLIFCSPQHLATPTHPPLCWRNLLEWCLSFGAFGKFYFFFWLVWTEVKSILHVSLSKWPIKQFKPVQQSRQNAQRAYCPNICTVPWTLGPWTPLWILVFYWTFNLRVAGYLLLLWNGLTLNLTVLVFRTMNNCHRFGTIATFHRAICFMYREFIVYVDKKMFENSEIIIFASDMRES